MHLQSAESVESELKSARSREKLEMSVSTERKKRSGINRTWSENWTFLGLPKTEMRSRHYRFQGELESAVSDLDARINPSNQKMTI
ncbi:hypothetical protein ALC53_03407 [Atta colombica]|uniref:Uncharacterized protein n=1 Tax=Atta colombica TaxID=520822 RepID=A0A195BN96_9HYME|nr:hypothetical protein ALC53_03407 [Atta colombica]